MRALFPQPARKLLIERGDSWGNLSLRPIYRRAGPAKIGRPRGRHIKSKHQKVHSDPCFAVWSQIQTPGTQNAQEPAPLSQSADVRVAQPSMQR